MSALVCFSTATGQWAVEVEWSRRVVPAAGITPLPAPQPEVVGLMVTQPGGEPIPILDALGGTGDAPAHVLELEASGRRFGLLVGRVTAVVPDGRASIGPPPAGQQDPVVGGVAVLDGDRALLVDPPALSRRLDRLPQVTR